MNFEEMSKEELIEYIKNINDEKILHFKKNHILILFKIRRQSMDTDGQNKSFDP